MSKRCTKGKSCGGTCISAVKMCRVDVGGGISGGVSEVAKQVQSRDKVTEGGGSSTAPKTSPKFYSNSVLTTMSNDGVKREIGRSKDRLVSLATRIKRREKSGETASRKQIQELRQEQNSLKDLRGELARRKAGGESRLSSPGKYKPSTYDKELQKWLMKGENRVLLRNTIREKRDLITSGIAAVKKLKGEGKDEEASRALRAISEEQRVLKAYVKARGEIKRKEEKTSQARRRRLGIL